MFAVGVWAGVGRYMPTGRVLLEIISMPCLRTCTRCHEYAKSGLKKLHLVVLQCSQTQILTSQRGMCSRVVLFLVRLRLLAMRLLRCLRPRTSVVLPSHRIRFGERGWRVIMATDKYKSLFHMRSPPIVKSMHRMSKDNDLKRAKTRARIAARADTKAKARVRWLSGIVLLSFTYTS